MAKDKEKDEVKITWNKWWTFAVIAAVITVIAIILEYLGYLKEFGIVIGLSGLIITIFLGLRASTGSALKSTKDIMGEEHKEIAEILKEHTKLLEEIRDLLKR